MASKEIRPKWWQLYLTFPLLLALFAIDGRLKISTRGHQIVQIGIILIVFGLIRQWLKANSSALSNMDKRQFSGKVTVIEIPSYSLPENEKQGMFHLPDSEIKGMLDNTFEMDYIDAESFTVEENRRN